MTAGLTGIQDQMLTVDGYTVYKGDNPSRIQVVLLKVIVVFPLWIDLLSNGG